MCASNNRYIIVMYSEIVNVIYPLLAEATVTGKSGEGEAVTRSNQS